MFFQVSPLDFSRDNREEEVKANNTSREEDEAVDISNVSGVNKDMEDVKELKR